MSFFGIKPKLLGLKYSYPTPKELEIALQSMGFTEIKEFIRLWLTEGVPYAFKDIPYLYERIRSCLAKELCVLSKNIFLVGSGKVGLSLAPDKFPREFGRNSDLDFNIIDDKLFDKLCEDFYAWSVDYRKGICKPRDRKEEEYWLNNLIEVPDNIRRGFIDNYRIPAHAKYVYRYKFTVIVPRIVYLIKTYMKKNYSNQKIKVSFRIYNHWDSFFTQMELNLRSLISRIS